MVIPSACQWLPTAMNIVNNFNNFFLLVAHVNYEMGDIVAECNFDGSRGMETCCDKIYARRGYNRPLLQFGSRSPSSLTGPSEDHTSSTGMSTNFKWNKNDDIITYTYDIQIYDKLIKYKLTRGRSVCADTRNTIWYHLNPSLFFGGMSLPLDATFGWKLCPCTFIENANVRKWDWLKHMKGTSGRRELIHRWVTITA